MPVTRGEEGLKKGGYKPKTKPSSVPRSKPTPHRDTGFRHVTPPSPSTARAPARATPTAAPASPRHPAVAATQRKLRAAGLKVTVDVIYGPETDAAIRRYNSRLATKNARERVQNANITKPRAPERGPGVIALPISTQALPVVPSLRPGPTQLV